MLRLTRPEFIKLANFIKSNYGINLSDEKEALVTGRLQSLVKQLGFSSFSEYYDYLIADKTGEAAAVLVNKITTNHTFFMRETEHFYFLRDRVLPFLRESARNKDLRIWSAGCSTGEEPYTLAMVIDQFFGSEKGWWDTKILATDISSKALDVAKKGVYATDRISNLPAQWRLNYFQKLDAENSIIANKIRQEVIFRKFNLMDARFPFKKKFHVIFCRNVMIYFDAPTKNILTQKFHDILEPGGFLFIGHSESINRNETKFKYIMPAVYRKE